MMRYWYSLYELLKVPLAALFAGMVMMGIGRLLTNSAFSSLYVVTLPFLKGLGTVLLRTGMFIVTNFPVLLMVRMVTRKNGSGTSVTASLAGYAAFLAATMAVDNSSLPAEAFSSVLGLSMTRSVTYTSQSVTVYPLQTGMIAAVITALITLLSIRLSALKKENGFFSFIPSSVWILLTTMILSMAAGTLTAFIWPYFYAAVSWMISFISADTANPINLALYGICDRLLSVLNLNSLIRTPFWYAASGGSWVSLSGSSVAGDVNIWTAQAASGAIAGMSGRFITPYYILNIFAIPSMLLAVYTMQTDRTEKKRTFVLFAAAGLFSMLTGILLPMEICMLLFCPFLFFAHVGITGLLYAVLQSMQLYLGYYSTSQTTLTALPGTLMEAVTYAVQPDMQQVILKLCIVGAITAVLYFVMTRCYFRYLAVDLFRTGQQETVLKKTVTALGGVQNISSVASSYSSVSVTLYDPSLLDRNALFRTGALSVKESGTGCRICFGAASTMIRIGIRQEIRDNIRGIDD